MTHAQRTPVESALSEPDLRLHRTKPLLAWAGWCALAAVVIWIGAARGWWFLPFVAGVATGLGGWIRIRRSRWAVAQACLGALAGWLLPLLIRLAEGQPVGGTARVVAAEAGLPPYALVTLAATLLVAVLQAAVGVWAGWATAGLVGAISGRGRLAR
jgi:hypothetical protein